MFRKNLMIEPITSAWPDRLVLVATRRDCEHTDASDLSATVATHTCLTLA